MVSAHSPIVTLAQEFLVGTIFLQPTKLCPDQYPLILAHTEFYTINLIGFVPIYHSIEIAIIYIIQ